MHIKRYVPVGSFILYLYLILSTFNACVFNLSWTNYTYFKLEALYFGRFYYYYYGFLSYTTKILYYIVSFFKVRVCIIRINRVLNLLTSLVAVLLNYIIPIFFVEFELWMFGFFF